MSYMLKLCCAEGLVCETDGQDSGLCFEWDRFTSLIPLGVVLERNPKGFREVAAGHESVNQGAHVGTSWYGGWGEPPRLPQDRAAGYWLAPYVLEGDASKQGGSLPVATQPKGWVAQAQRSRVSCPSISPPSLGR